jgi:hypothetical protein
VRRRNRRTGPVRGVAAGHEETESRFLGRAQAVVWKLVARGALSRNDRLGSAAGDSGGSYAPGLVKQFLSFRGPATLQSEECATGCRAEESTVGLLEAGCGSPRQTCGGETAGRGQCGASRQATRKRKVDSSVARKRLCGRCLHVVRSLGMTDWACGQCRGAGFTAWSRPRGSAGEVLRSAPWLFRTCRRRSGASLRKSITGSGSATPSQQVNKDCFGR